MLVVLLMLALRAPATELATSYQQVSKLVGNGAFDQCFFGASVAFSGTGDILAVGGPGDYSDQDATFRGAVWVYAKQSGGYWSQQGPKLMGTGAVGDTTDFGRSVALSKAGDVLAGGCPLDSGYAGAVWIFVQKDGNWSQQGEKLVGSGAIGKTQFGISVALSSLGDVLAVGGEGDNGAVGAVWIFVQKNGVWSQQGDKLIGTGAVGPAYQGASVALSSAGDTLAVGGYDDNSGVGAVWVWLQKNGVWSQQGNKLVGSGGSGEQNQGISVSLSSGGDVLASGGTEVSSIWIFTNQNGAWSQGTAPLVGTGQVGSAGIGFSTALSGAGDVLATGGPYDNSDAGAVWIFGRNGSAWAQQGNKYFGAGGINPSNQGWSVALTGGAEYLVIGARYDTGGVGAVWIFQAVNSSVNGAK